MLPFLTLYIQIKLMIIFNKIVFVNRNMIFQFHYNNFCYKILFTEFDEHSVLHIYVNRG